MAKKAGNWDDEGNEVASNWVKFNVPMEDKILGTLITKRQMKSTLQGKEGELVWVYEVKADLGSFHELDESKVVVPTPITINADEIWSVGGKNSIDVQMRNIRIGQKVGFKFIDTQPSKTKGFAPAKNIRVYAPKNDEGTPEMDTEWLEANAVDPLAAEFNK
jgi:hypothetical protein